MRANEMYLELHVPDFEAVKEFYAKLGFSVVWERKPEGKKGYLILKRDQSILCFWAGNKEVYNQSYFKRYSKNTTRGYGVEIVIPVSDVEKLHKQIQKVTPVVEKLKVRPWGLKDFRIIDPFGFYLRFTEPHDILDKKWAVP